MAVEEVRQSRAGQRLDARQHGPVQGGEAGERACRGGAQRDPGGILEHRAEGGGEVRRRHGIQGAEAQEVVLHISLPVIS